MHDCGQVAVPFVVDVDDAGGRLVQPSTLDVLCPGGLPGLRAAWLACPAPGESRHGVFLIRRMLDGAEVRGPAGAEWSTDCSAPTKSTARLLAWADRELVALGIGRRELVAAGVGR